MISPEQCKLAEELKAVHRSLRKRTQEVGSEQAWQEHVGNKDVLEKYAGTMKLLAETYWTWNNQGDRHSYCRISWVIRNLRNYYFNGEYEKHLKKDQCVIDNNTLIKPSVLKLLDVGSCYNPFRNFEFLDITAIDLCPASPEVIKCNFLDIVVKNELDVDCRTMLLQDTLPANYFDSVVFSLFLEYLPSPLWRFKACKIAWDVLKERGLLLIVTPYSKYTTANTGILHMWKSALASIGFTRIRVDNMRFLCCMVFRKSSQSAKETTYDDAAIMCIPQDFVDYSIEEKPAFTTRGEDSDVAANFINLPSDNLFLD